MTTATDRPTIPVNIADEMRSSYIDYAMSVIVSRALPDARDGLKPVQRRILYAMHDMGIRSATQHRKSARIVGEVLGRFHPHGDHSVYEALVRLAQPFSMRVPLVDGQGNFGSIDADPPAAMRYTEARMTPAAEYMLADINESTVPFTDNFDTTTQEPTVLPNRIPNLLINGATGIAVGMATNMPPHNPAEVCDAVIHLIDHPDATTDDLMKIVTGPDLPTAATIRGAAGIRDIYENGRGKFVMQAVAEIQQTRSNRQQIVISELPYQTVKSKLVEQIADLVKNKTVSGISEIRDESDRTGIRVVLDLSRDAQPQVILNNLYQRTAMQTNFNAIMLALIDGRPQELSLRQLLQHFIDHRTEVIRNQTRYRLSRAQERLHIVQGLITALDNIDRIINTIRASADTETARAALITDFDLTAIQAQAILDMQLRRLSNLESNRLNEERDELETTINQLQNTLDSPRQILNQIKRQTREVKQKYPEPRRTVIKSEEVTETAIEELVVQEDVVISLTQRSYLKRIPLLTYRAQRRGGRGVLSGKADDPTTHIKVVSTHDQLLFFTNHGRVHTLDVHRIPETNSRTAQGVLLINLVSLAPNERVQTMEPLAVQHEQSLHIFATRTGRVAAISSAAISSLRYNKAGVIKIKDQDELVNVTTAMPDDNVLMITKSGKASALPISDIPVHSRGTSGVIGITTDESDPVVAMDTFSSPDQFVVIATSNGHAKANPLSAYPVRQRKRKGSSTFNTDAKTGHVVDAQVVDKTAFDSNEYDVFVLSAKGQVARMNLSEIRVTNTRKTKGVIVWRQHIPDDHITSIACFHSPENDTDTDPAPAPYNPEPTRSPAPETSPADPASQTQQQISMFD